MPKVDPSLPAISDSSDASAPPPLSCSPPGGGMNGV